METEPLSSVPTITPFPTLPPISGPPQAGEEVRPTPEYLTAPPEGTGGGEIWLGPSRVLIIAGVAVGCLVIIGLVGIAAVGLALWLRRRRKPTNEPPSL
jgi:hypothetical protein